MGGGKKRRTLTQMEKAQRAKQREERRSKAKKERRASMLAESKAARIIPPDPGDERIISQLRSMKVITPYTVASRFNLVLSVAKDFLEECHRRGIITYVSGGRNLRIYKPSER
ncbi:MAG: 30S ribosomal protein S25 [Candidatus Bathyarchaeota archaeon B63]|nr:MAG: 30S ribosomal protein S25 [Candidatus Bathyarchaeota archaeon B63]